MTSFESPHHDLDPLYDLFPEAGEIASRYDLAGMAEATSPERVDDILAAIVDLDSENGVAA